jgi:hypothetical protein
MKGCASLRNHPMESVKKKKKGKKIGSLNFRHDVFYVLDLQVPKGRLCHLIPVTLFSLLNFLNPWSWDWWFVPKLWCGITTLHCLRRVQISHDLAKQALVWLCLVLFRVIRFGAVRFGALYVNLRWPHTCKCQFEGKNLSCIWVNMVISVSMSLAGNNKVYNGTMLIENNR